MKKNTILGWRGKTRKSLFLTVFIILVIALLIPLFQISVNAQQESTEQVYRIFINPNGSADWSYEQHFILNNNIEREAWLNYVDNATFDFPGFEDYQQNIANFIVRACEICGRSMESENFTCGTRLEDSVVSSIGIITFNFTWNGFAEVIGDSIYVGDAFESFLLPNGASLIFKIPEGWKISDINPATDYETEDEVAWYGYRSFNSGQPSFVVFIPPSWMFAILVLIGLGIVPIFLYFFISREKPIDDNQFQILNILEQNGNVMYQRDLVKQTNWSNAKVSLIITDLLQNNLIIKIKEGRMNVIQLNKKI